MVLLGFRKFRGSDGQQDYQTVKAKVAQSLLLRRIREVTLQRDDLLNFRSAPEAPTY